MLLGAVIATYNPPRQVKNIVAELTREGVAVVVVDDASEAPDSAQLLSDLRSAGAEVIRKTVNSGIGNSLNIGVQILLKRDVDFVMTLDQDSSLSPKYFAESVAYIERLSVSGLPVGLVTAATLNGNQRRPASLHHAAGADPISVGIDVMQSGSVYPANILSAVGPFREDLVMDCIDTEYCLRLRREGYLVVWNPNTQMSHALGDTSPATLFGRRVALIGHAVNTSNHSPQRRFYMSRNRILLLKQYGRTDRGWARKSIKAYGKETLIALLFERPRFAKFRAFIAGTAQGLSGKSGYVRSGAIDE